jgi:hypothetical protein
LLQRDKDEAVVTPKRKIIRRKKENKNRRKIKEGSRGKEKGRVLWSFHSLTHLTH